MRSLLLCAFLSVSGCQTTVEKDPVKRLEAWLGRSTTIQADIKYSFSPGDTTGTGTIVLSKPDKAVFTVKIPRLDFEFRNDGKRMIEIDHVEQVYEILPKYYQPVDPPGNVVPTIIQLFPRLLTTKKLETPPDTKIESVASATTDPTDTERFNFTVPTQFGTATYDFWVAKDGAIQRSSRTLNERGQSSSLTMDFSNYRLNEKIADSVFTVSEPLSYSPWVLPRYPKIRGQGESIKLTTWKNASGQDVNLGQLSTSKPLLVFVTQAGCDLSPKLYDNLRTWDAAMKSVGGESVALSIDGAVVGAPITSYSGSPIAVEEVFAYGTPLVYVLKPGGEVALVRFGFDPKTATTFSNDILEAIKTLKK